MWRGQSKIGERMVVIFGTIGSNPKVLIPTIRARDNVEKVVYYYARDTEREKVSEKASRVVQEYCERKKIKYEPRMIENASDLLKIAKKIRADLSMQKAQKNEIVFNVTGGTKVMCAAALLACILEGVNAVYVNEDTKEELELPVIPYEYKHNLSKGQKKILQAIHALGRNCTLTELVKQTNLKKSTISYHISKLRRMGLVEIREGEDLREKYINVQPATELMLE